jgi:hypothetical protein
MKAEQHDNIAAGTFNPTSYILDEGQLGRNMQCCIKTERSVDMKLEYTVQQDAAV